MDQEMDLTLSGAARAPPLASSSSIYRAKEPFHVQVIPPNAQANASPAYVTHLLSLSTSFGVPTLLAVADDSTLTLIDKTSGVVAESHRVFKDARITQAKPLGSGSSVGSFVASVSNGTVACWDTRTGLSKPVWTLQGTSKAPYLCVEPSPNDTNTVVAGTEQYGHGDSDIDIWDIRSIAAPKSKYNEVHSDDITVLQYHPDAANHSGILLSGSTDGLVSAIDTTIAEEDDAVISVGNTGNSVARVGWIYSSSSSASTSSVAGAMDTNMDAGDEAADLAQVETEARRRALGKVWAVGDMQTLSIFDADKFDPILLTTDVRSSSSLRPPWSTDYVIDAFTTLSSFPNPAANESEHLKLFVGKSEGAFATISIPTTETTSSWNLRAVFPEQGDGTFYGHADIVRSVEWDAGTNTLYTGGEDGNLCFWNFDASSNQVAATGSIALGSVPPATAAYSGGDDSQSSSRSGSRNATPGRSQRYTPYK